MSDAVITKRTPENPSNPTLFGGGTTGQRPAAPSKWFHYFDTTLQRGVVWDGVQWREHKTGPQGFQGFQGYQGNANVQGLQGSQGVQGAQGSQGATGVSGTGGGSGIQGAQGRPGAQGVRGNQGSLVV